MAVSTGVSCVLSVVICLLLFSGTQTYRIWLSSTPLRTIFGGFLSSIIFTMLLTSIGNLETLIFGKGSQAGLFPEVTLAMTVALAGSAMIHRVCVTTCLIFSGISLYYMHKLSQQVNSISEQPVVTSVHKKKRH